MRPVKIVASEWMTPRYPEGRIDEVAADALDIKCFSKNDVCEFTQNTYKKLRDDFGICDEAKDIALAVAIAHRAMQGQKGAEKGDIAIFLSMQESSLCSGAICGEISDEGRAWLEPARWFSTIRRELGLMPCEDVWVNAACASGNYGLAAAHDYVSESPGRRALVIACFSMFPGASHVFIDVGIAATKTCRPFHTERDGTLVSEGAAAVLLSDEENVDIGEACSFLGYGLSCDAYNQVAPDPSGDSVLKSIVEALDAAGLTPYDIEYINAHGTGTWVNDEIELAIIRKIGLQNAQLSSTKAYTGHCMIASALIEACICSQIFAKGVIPLDLYRGSNVRTWKKGPPKFVLSNSFGFGGANSAIVFGQ
ncbi:beta-ketoacyl synthase N-terminal-like domain-containing protein [Xanthomonas axonopodis]|uniref:beta-ketoacyl synthase N-terminal-like domain-containing protein n=1 Tax=Xanthomonas axonopodis TaxID=53413 RepID=UPI0009986059|nr:beta-ketoacyl synthase N-terminal-like domain-containing protein [Xanthomonas axonopodis]